MTLSWAVDETVSTRAGGRVVVVVAAAGGEGERDDGGEREGGATHPGDATGGIRRPGRRASHAASAAPIGVDGGPSTNGHSSSAIRR